jgi:hypothetical protein
MERLPNTEQIAGQFNEAWDMGSSMRTSLTQRFSGRATLSSPEELEMQSIEEEGELELGSGSLGSGRGSGRGSHRGVGSSGSSGSGGDNESGGSGSGRGSTSERERGSAGSFPRAEGLLTGLSRTMSPRMRKRSVVGRGHASRLADYDPCHTLDRSESADTAGKREKMALFREDDLKVRSCYAFTSILPPLLPPPPPPPPHARAAAGPGVRASAGQGLVRRRARGDVDGQVWPRPQGPARAGARRQTPCALSATSHGHPFSICVSIYESISLSTSIPVSILCAPVGRSRWR